MRLMGIEAIYQKPRTSLSHPAHKKYPYLLKDMDINRPNQVWCTDITYIPIKRGFLYLVAIMDWRSLKYECVYLKSFETGQQARTEIGAWMEFYNSERPHSVFDGLTPKEMYHQGMQESECTQFKTAA